LWEQEKESQEIKDMVIKFDIKKFFEENNFGLCRTS